MRPRRSAATSRAHAARGRSTSTATGRSPKKASGDTARVEIRGGGLTGEVGGKPQLTLQLGNKGAQAVWVQVRMVPPSPNTECALTKPLAPGEAALYSCAQESIVPDADYSIVVTVYRDEAATDQAETRQTSMRFIKRDADALAAYLTVPELPATFADVVGSEKPNSLGSALFGGAAPSGTLVVTTTALQYTLKKNVTEIPIAQIRSSAVRQLGAPGDSTRTWVIVEYGEASASRTMGFQGSALRGAGSRVADIDKAISYAMAKLKAGADNVQ